MIRIIVKKKLRNHHFKELSIACYLDYEYF